MATGDPICNKHRELLPCRYCRYEEVTGATLICQHGRERGACSTCVSEEFWRKVEETSKDVQKWPGWRVKGLDMGDGKKWAAEHCPKCGESILPPSECACKVVIKGVKADRRKKVMRWVLDILGGEPVPERMTMEEINEALDDVERIIKEKRKLYPR